MREITKDWCDFCENKNTLDKYHFHTLFWEDITKNDLEEIFKYFPGSSQLIKLTSEYIFTTHHDNSVTNEKLIDLALKDINQKKTLLSDSPELIKTIENLTPQYVEDFNLVIEKKNEHPYCDFFNEVDFQLTEKWKLEDKKTFALNEAFYGLTKNYEMVWYLFSPLTNTDIDFKPYTEFTNLKGIYSFSGNQLLVSREV